MPSGDKSGMCRVLSMPCLAGFARSPEPGRIGLWIMVLLLVYLVTCLFQVATTAASIS